MENWEEILNSEDCSDKVIDYRPLLKDIDAKIIVVNEETTKLLAYGNTIEEIQNFLDKGIVVFLPPSDSHFAG